MSNRPKDVDGHCNAWLTISDDFGDNEATCRCQLPAGHLGRHREEWMRGEGNPVEVTWEIDQRPELEAEEAMLLGLSDAHLLEGPEDPGEDYLAGYCAGVEEREDFEREDQELRELAAH